MKLRNPFYLLLALPLAFASCSEVPSSTDGGDVMDFTLELTSEATMTFEALGGEGTIAYKYDNPSGVKPEAISNADWITNFTVGDNTITFTVAANEGEARTATIYVAAFHKSFEVTINQNALEVEGDYCLLDANHALGIYFGDTYTPGYADNFYLYLSDKGFDEEYYELPNGVYYLFDIYAPIGDALTPLTQTTLAIFGLQVSHIAHTTSWTTMLMTLLSGTTQHQELSLLARTAL